MTDKTTATKDAKPPIVKFTRYLRFYVEDDAFHERVSNLHRMTFLIEIDYEKKEIRYQYSACNNDNFSKKVGREIAEKRDQITIPLENNIITGFGVLNDIFESASNDPGHLKMMRDLRKIMSQGVST